ncbi:hypothetical protein VCHA53P481_60005 [Vibrio chagasii]|nr:hypothetical protein VCHA43P284_60263 [Vibrio chagasii]CAH7375083.1 hypothetical protein VCHA53P481_60005 [Vibrio chagasii]
MWLTDGIFKSLYYSTSTSRLLIDFVSESEIRDERPIFNGFWRD